MISEPTLYAAIGAVYASTLAVLLGWLWRNPDARHRLCAPVLFVVGFGAVASLLQAGGFGGVQIADGTLNVPSVLNDLLGYSVLWATSALLAGVPLRTLALVTAIPFVQVLAFNVASVAGGSLALAGGVVVIVGHLLLLVVFRGSVWESAKRLAAERRLLHWKSRNLLLFMIGMLIVFALLSLASVFGTFVSTVLSLYVGLLIRVGFAGFLFVNLGSLVGDDPGEDTSAGGGRTPDPTRVGAEAGGD